MNIENKTDNSRLDRRSFIKKSSLTLAGLGAALLLNGCGEAEASAPTPRVTQQNSSSGCSTPGEKAEAPKNIDFSGYTWGVSENIGKKRGPGEPGNNYFSDSNENVFPDSQNRLHLAIKPRDSASCPNWYCSEIGLNDALGLGTYSFTLNSAVDQMDQNVVFGMFLYSDDSHELDIEWSPWSIVGRERLEFSVQPTSRYSSRKVQARLSGQESTHQIILEPKRITFLSFNGDVNPITSFQESEATKYSNLLGSWQTTNFPPDLTSDANLRKFKMISNLWLNEGKPPTNGQASEVIIKKFAFSKLG